MRNQLTVPAAIDHQARDKVGRASHNHVGNQVSPAFTRPCAVSGHPGSGYAALPRFEVRDLDQSFTNTHDCADLHLFDLFQGGFGIRSE
jgi:hypothetical protein